MWFRNRQYRRAIAPPPAAYETANKLLSANYLTAAKYQDTVQTEAGYSLVYDVDTSILRKPGTIQFRADAKGKIAEIEFKFCNEGFVANKSADINGLLLAIATITNPKIEQRAPDMKPAPGSKEKRDAVDWISAFMRNVVAAGVIDEASVMDRTKFAQWVLQAGTFEDKTIEAVKKITTDPKINDKEWKALAEAVWNHSGEYRTTKEQIAAAIKELTQHEQYGGGYQIKGYDRDGAAIVALADSYFPLLFAFAPGPKGKLALKDAVLYLCNVSYGSGPNVPLAKRLVSSMVDLAIANDVAANPELEKPKQEITEEDILKWDQTKINEEMANGLVVKADPGDKSLSIIWNNEKPLLTSQYAAMRVDTKKQREAQQAEKDKFNAVLKQKLETLAATGVTYWFWVDDNGNVTLRDMDQKVIRKL